MSFERFGLDYAVGGLKSKETALNKLAELMVAYKVGENISIFRRHDFSMKLPIGEHLGLPEFNIRGLYRAVEILGRNREYIIRHFRRTLLRMCGPEITDAVFDWTPSVYFRSKPDLAKRGHSKDEHLEGC